QLSPIKSEEENKYARKHLRLVFSPRGTEAAIPKLIHQLREAAGTEVRLAASMLYRGDDARRLEKLAALANQANARLIATSAVLYNRPARRPLQDAVTCIREHVTLAKAGKRLAANAERHLKPAEEMTRLFRHHPEAIEETLRFIESCDFSLDDLK